MTIAEQKVAATIEDALVMAEAAAPCIIADRFVHRNRPLRRLCRVGDDGGAFSIDLLSVAPWRSARQRFERYLDTMW